MIHLVNGQKQLREKPSKGITLLPCGCAFDVWKWLQICERHWPEWERLHEEAARAHAEREL